MATNKEPQYTDFSRDVLGRYICNGFDEAINSGSFDIIIIGGGTFGAALAADLFFRSKPSSEPNTFKPQNLRILVLEAGPFILTEHVQNLPNLGLFDPSETSLKDLGPNPQPRNQVWGLAWHSNEKFDGLAYCVGGRSLFWGGWSPQFLDSEMPTTGASKNLWPSSVVQDLKVRFFNEANRQIGANEATDFINGPLHDEMGKKLLQALKNGAVPEAMPIPDLPLQVTDPPATSPSEEELRKLDAPYAMQTSGRGGFFPNNKFSSVPLLMTAAREAFFEAQDRKNKGDSRDLDAIRRLMVVPKCHVTRLLTEDVMTATGQKLKRVSALETSSGVVSLKENGSVVLAMGAIESTRLALVSFQGLGLPNYDLIGKNLMTHTRPNIFLELDREELFPPNQQFKELEVSALQVRGRHDHGDGTSGHFHLQITASGLGAESNLNEGADAELFRKVPYIDIYEKFLESFSETPDTKIRIAIRAIGEMEPQNPSSYVKLDPENDEFGVPRAFVAINDDGNPNTAGKNNLTVKDKAVFKAMTKAMTEVARIFKPDFADPNITEDNADGLGTVHHEAGTLVMGDDPSKSVTNLDARFHYVTNAYVGDLSVLPTCGSANPMLPGIALARRLAKHLVPEGDGVPENSGRKIRPFSPTITVPTPSLPTPDAEGFRLIFDGQTTTHWQMAGKGNFFVLDGVLQSVSGDGLGLFWCTVPTPPNFIFRLEWLLAKKDPSVGIFEENSGVLIRFPHPDSKGYYNPAHVPDTFGFEVQIDPEDSGDDKKFRETGAIYNQKSQQLDESVTAKVGEWNTFEIRVDKQTYMVFLNGQKKTTFQNTDSRRGLPSTPAEPSFIGLQAYGGARVAFRNIRIKEL